MSWFLRPAPADRLVWFRVLVGAYATAWCLIRLPAHVDHAAQRSARWDPVGVLSGLSSPLPDALVVGLSVAAPVLAALFAVGWRYRLVAPLFAAVLLVVTTLDSSFGQVFHTENLLVLHVLILAAAPGAGQRLGSPTRSEEHGWPLRLAALVVVAAYVLAGVAKLRIGGLDWVTGDSLRNLVAHDNLRKAVLGDWHSPLGEELVGWGWPFPLFAVLTLVIELGAPLALVRRWCRPWVVSAWLFHVGVLALMAVLFPYQLFGVAFAPFFALERLTAVAPRRLLKVLARYGDGGPSTFEPTGSMPRSR